MADAAGEWAPASIAEVSAWFSSAGSPWWVAGGYAIELAICAPVRVHDDVDVLVLRRDQLMVQRALPDWEWWAADPPGQLRPWLRDEILPLSVHDVWCRPACDQPWRVQVMIDEVDGDWWVSRRDARIRRELKQIGAVTVDGVPYLLPEIQLFYKAKMPREKDEVDFAAATLVMTAEQRQWLAEAIELVYGGHPWAARLSV